MSCPKKNSITGNILVTIAQAPQRPAKGGKAHKSRSSKNNFHWTSPDPDLLRQFIAKCTADYGLRKTGMVLNALVSKWVRGRTKIRI